MATPEAPVEADEQREKIPSGDLTPLTSKGDWESSTTDEAPDRAESLLPFCDSRGWATCDSSCHT